MLKRTLIFGVGSLLLMALIPCGALFGQGVEAENARKKAQTQMKQGNFRDALVVFEKLCTSSDTDHLKVSNDLVNAVQCINRLGNQKQLDDLLEKTVAAHSKNWRLLQTAAKQYLTVMHYGYQISGEYERGPHRGGGKIINSQERDRVRAMQLMIAAEPYVLQEEDKNAIASFYSDLAAQLFYYRGYYESWRLQYKTDLTTLPDYDEGYPRGRNGGRAPVDEDGNPVYYAVASDWDNALNDGERWRLCLDMVERNAPNRRNEIRQQIAQFARNQFGVPTMANDFFWPVMIEQSDQSKGKDESGTYALHTLTQDETIAKLASGIKRFKLNDDYNFIKILEDIVENPATGYAESALQQLAQIHEDRRQYVKAAEYWRQNIEKFGPGRNAWKRQRLDQIVKNWGRFEGNSVTANGKAAKLDYRYRNGSSVKLTVQPVDIDEMIADALKHLNSKPDRLDYNQVNFQNLGYRLINGKGDKYIGKVTESWTEKVTPRKDHYDDRVTIDVPKQKPGVYLVTASMADGNTSRIIVWHADTVLVRKPLSDESLFYLADAITGKPIAGSKLEFVGYSQNRINKTINGRRTSVLDIKTKEFSETTDKNGQVIVGKDKLDQGYQWLIQAKSKDGRRAFMGFQGFWHTRIYDQEYKATKTFVITDRPVYRPGDTIKFKIWTRYAQYDKEFVSQWADRAISYRIQNPKGESVKTESLQADAYGGIEGEFTIPSDGMLGQYSIACNNGAIGGNSFRVEEYKKPEFEVVVDAPTDPIKLGDKFSATIKADYFFGAPVTNATVSYTVTRQDHENRWYPVGEWDWCFGPGYWWFAYDMPWFPGFYKWCGCFRPYPWWGYQAPAPKEIVAKREVPIGADGTVKVEIDTALAKELHGDSNQKYSISVEVRDSSRRTILGSGDVLVADKPFKIFSWVNRGYYRTGDVVQANFKAQTLDKKPVQGTGKLSLLKVTYDEKQEPVETEVAAWDVDTDADGRAKQQLKPSLPGQYRLKYELTDVNENTIEGGYVFTVIGERFDSASYRFNNLELIPEKRDYQPGEKLKLQINSNQKDGYVLLFSRPSNNVYQAPQMIQLDGKSQVVEIEVTKKDMPNFFLEAVTVTDGGVYSESKEIVVPPEKRVLNVNVIPSSENYRPGQKAKVKIHVTDHTGENYSGALAVSVYDKAVEYISGGSNTPDIKSFFWKWRRRHQTVQNHSLQRYMSNLIRNGDQGMNNIGMFGEGVVEETGPSNAVLSGNVRFGGGGSGGGFGGGGLGGGGGMSAGFAGPGGGATFSRTMAKTESLAMDASAPLPGGMAGGGAGGEMGDDDGGGTQLVKPKVRSNFADTAFWQANLTTNDQGLAEIELDMPESLTTWKINVWGMGHGTRVGNGSAEVITRKDLLVRLQAPRFFVQKDRVTLSAIVNNYLATEKDVKVGLELDGPQLRCLDSPTTSVKVDSNGEARVDWTCSVMQPGEVKIRMSALTDEESDAMEMTFPVKVHGFLKMESFAGTVRPENKSSIVDFVIPTDRQADKTRLEVRYSPTLAMAMIDALPYLNDYPHGCTEQTLNRWLPSLMTQKMLIDMGVDLADVANKKTNLNAQEIGDDKERAKQWDQYGLNPVWNQARLQEMTDEGLSRLAAMQVSDGGWGWFSGLGERSYGHTTAVVVHGLQKARDNDLELPKGMLERGLKWLTNYQKQQVQLIKNYAAEVRPSKSSASNLDAMVYSILTEEEIDNVEMREFLYRDRNNLSVYAKALFGLGLENVGDQKKLDMILTNIDQYVIQDSENETAYVKNPNQGYWYYWYGSETEANASYLKLLSRTDPKGKTAPRLVKYLLNNRKHATYWNSTRDTALCVEAFADYIVATGENKPDMTVEVLLDGELKKEVQINAKNLFTFDNQFVMTGADVADGDHKIEIRRKGSGPVYWNAYVTNFSTEDYITKAGLEVKIERKYYRLTPEDKSIKVRGDRGQAVDQKVEKFKRTLLEDLATLNSGDLVEVELTVVSKNDYEYLLFEDYKPAGFETVNVRSGYTNSGMRAYTEYRDDRVNFFVRQLARGNHSVSYRMRAEIPGRFSALPARAAAMYAPELKGNSDEIKLQVKDGE